MPGSIGLPQFSAIQVDGFKDRLEAMLKNHLEVVARVLQDNPLYTWDNLMHPLEHLDDELERFWSPFSHLHSVVSSQALRDGYEACLPILSAYEAAIGQNQALYQAIQSIEVSALDIAQKKIISDRLLDFELSGVALSPRKKKQFEAIQARLAELSNQFNNNVLDAEQAFTLPVAEVKRLEGIPERVILSAKKLAKEKGVFGYVINLEYPTYKAVMSYAKDRSLREELYHAYMTRASDQGPNAGLYDNTPIIAELLVLRHEKAALLGFGNYAEWSLATKMATSTQQVMAFMEELLKRVRKQAEGEVKELESFAKKQHALDLLMPWDVAYFSEKRRKVLYDLTQEELRPYFPQPKVMDGLFAIVNQLYGMCIEEIKDVDTWHKDVQCYGVVDEKNQVRGYIYTDLYARPNKQGGAWMDSLQGRRKLEGGVVQRPIATLTCNFAKATTNQLALLSHDEVLTLFHEFGHCLHHVLTQVDYLNASGINGVEWDAVELPSQIFENWCWDKESLQLLTAHVDTQEALPDALFDRLIATRNYQSAMAMLRQLEFSLFDFCIHMAFDKNDKNFVNHVLATIREKTNVLPMASYNRFQNSFSHIFGGGYAAGYYSYSWAEVLSCDAFSRFEEEGVLNPKTGRDFLHDVLEIGSVKKASDAFKAFRGREATIDALLRHNGIF